MDWIEPLNSWSYCFPGPGFLVWSFDPPKILNFPYVWMYHIQGVFLPHAPCLGIGSRSIILTMKKIVTEDGLRNEWTWLIGFDSEMWIWLKCMLTVMVSYSGNSYGGMHKESSKPFAVINKSIWLSMEDLYKVYLLWSWKTTCFFYHKSGN